ncbi:methyl-accepting chemotaxis protein [Brevibacillus sp. SYSU BS000544]|uniref:methyl-accepting chemotaxis protein n=1 Tax=Brevibacillus sp. SYSU BS000544 TaxID=3416443 RepID=UPI003CE46ADB
MSELQNYMSIAKYLPELFRKKDLAVWATDEEKFIMWNTHGAFQLKIHVGEALKPDGTPAAVLRTKRAISRYVPREVYGTPCYSVAIPVTGGVIGLSVGCENEEQFSQSLDDVNQAIEHIGQSGAEIARDAASIAEFMATIKQTLITTEVSLRDIDQVGELIKRIADQTRLISLNAMIESARAGEHGRSFSVVAKEMQKLSEDTMKSIQDVRTSIWTIHQMFEQVQSYMAEADHKVQDQSTQTKEISNTIRELSASLQTLQDVFKNL